MKKLFSGLTALLLAACMMAQMFILAKAQEIECQNGEYLGTEENITGYIVPEDDSSEQNSRALDEPIRFVEGGGVVYTLIFSITAAKVTDLLPSNVGGKSFSLTTLPSAATNILCRGMLYHSLDGQVNSLEPMMYGGVCYYGYNYLYEYDTYISVYSLDAESGVFAKGSFSISEILKSNVTYYSFVKNRYPGGYVYGTWEIYYSET